MLDNGGDLFQVKCLFFAWLTLHVLASAETVPRYVVAKAHLNLLHSDGTLL